jgi:hypothetical protein
MADLDPLFAPVSVQYFSEEGPGDPEDEQFPPPYFYKYRLRPSRRPMPRDETALIYDLTLLLKRGETASKTLKLGESSFWKGRPDPVAALEALEDAEETEAVLLRRRNLEFESQEEFGYNDELKGDAPVGDYPPFTVGYAEDHWREGFFKIPNSPGRFNFAIETEEVFFEPFDTSDTDNYKVTSEPLYTADEVANLKLQAGKDAYLLLVPQWWKFTITFDAWVVWKWASPNFRIGLRKPFSVPAAPIAVPAGTGAGNLDNGTYYYVVSWTINGVETKGGAVSDAVVIVDNSTNGKVTISNIEQGPEGTEARTVYRTTANDTPDEYRDNFFLVEVIPNNDFGVEIEDNLIDGSFGTPSLNEYAYPFGNALENDWFYLAEDDSFDLERGGDPSEIKEEGFYFCINDGGDTWDDWQFCAADLTTPPSDGCFSYDKVRYRLAQAERQCTIEGFKKALCRPVFPTETREYSESPFTPGFPKLALAYNPDLTINFEDEDGFTEDASPTLDTDDYESVVITEELADAEAQRALAYWAENCNAFNAYFTKQYLVDIGIYATLASTSFDGQIFDNIGGVDGSFDVNLTTTNTPDGSSDHIFIAPENYGTSGPSHWFSANAKLQVQRANTPAGSLVAAIQLKRGETEDRFYIWRKTTSTGRDAVIATDIPFRTQANLDLTGLEEQRSRIRPNADSPPSVPNLDYTF